MDDYAGRVLADRYRLPLPPSDEYELTETRAFDTYSGQEVLVRQVPLPEVVEAEVLDAEGLPDGFTARDGGPRRSGGRAGTRAGTRRPADPVVRRAVEAAQAAAAIPDHPRLDQVFDVFAEGGSLWIVSELVAARPLAALLAEKPLTPYRAAEVASDVLMALRVLHAHGWVHRNITARTVLVCDDGRVMLTGLAVGAAEESLCGYDPVPEPPFEESGQEPGPQGGGAGAARGVGGPGGSGPGGGIDGSGDPEAARRAAIEAREARGLPSAEGETESGGSVVPARRSVEGSGDPRAARAGAIAAYRAGARAAARVQEAQQDGRAALPGARTDPDGGVGPHDNGSAQSPYIPGQGTAPGAVPPGRIADPYGVSGSPRTTAWHGAAPRGTTGGVPVAQGREQAALPPAPDTAAHGEPTRWDDLVADTPAPRRGPATALAAERARQARMAVVGPVTERWAPEQAGPVHENWQLAAPIGPATDLWALGALLFRAVQGHAPYPEESTAELVQMVCAEPEAGVHVVAAPPVDAGRLPVVRRRGELVRRRKAGLPAHHGRHKRAKQETGSPRRLGRTLLVLVLLAMAAAIAYAMLFMPKAKTEGGDGTDRTGAAGEVSRAPEPEASSEPRPDQTSPGPEKSPSSSAGSTETQTTGPDVADGFTLRKDSAGFQVAVAKGWDRTARGGSGQVVYSKGDFELIVVAGRDSASSYGSDPMAYQRERERELQPYRESSWATSTGLKTIEVGGRTMAEGQFTWTGGDGGELYVRNLAMLVEGRYHVVQVRGPESERDEVTRLYEQAAATYKVTG